MANTKCLVLVNLTSNLYLIIMTTIPNINPTLTFRRNPVTVSLWIITTNTIKVFFPTFFNSLQRGWDDFSKQLSVDRKTDEAPRNIKPIHDNSNNPPKTSGRFTV